MRYRRRPYEVEAFQWTGRSDQAEEPEWFHDCMRAVEAQLGHAYVKTVQGVQRALPGDYIVRKDDGTLDVYRGDTFEKLFEPAEEEER